MSANDNSQESIKELRSKLDELLEWFESDDFSPEEAIEKFAEAEKLADSIKVLLYEHKNKITVLKDRFDQENPE